MKRIKNNDPGSSGYTLLHSGSGRSTSIYLGKVNMLKRFSTKTRLVIVTTLIAAFLMPWASTASAFEKINTNFWGVAIKGYDTVAYHTEGRAVKGNSKFAYSWNDAKWYFVSKENRGLFVEDPERYSPQYGGH